MNNFDVTDVTNYVPNIEALDSVENIARFLSELGVYITVFGNETLESLGKSPELWIKSEQPIEVGVDAADNPDI